MTEYLEFTLDKFTFKVATDRLYNPEGVWAKAEGDRVILGLSDFFQQHNGDVAFAEMPPEYTSIAFGDEIASIETIKVDIEVPSPVSGTIVEVNPAMEMEPEAINLDPYDTGWLVVIEADDWETDRARLLDPEAYLAHIKIEAEEELKKG
jgi:glycine cleavage system H protein